MRHLKTIGTALAGLLSFGAIASEADAFVALQCDSSSWPNNQKCAFDGNAWFATAVTSSNAAKTAHSISLSMPAGGGGTGDQLRQAGAVALDGNSNTIAGSSIGSFGSTQVRSFSTAASSPPRRLATQLITAKFTAGALNPTHFTDDTWPQNLNTRLFNSSGTITRHCRVTGTSDSTLTQHTLSALVVVAGANCSGIALDSNGSLIRTVQDQDTGTPTSLTFTTTAAARPRRLVGAIPEV